MLTGTAEFDCSRHRAVVEQLYESRRPRSSLLGFSLELGEPCLQTGGDGGDYLVDA
jgi:hypothetical protein